MKSGLQEEKGVVVRRNSKIVYTHCKTYQNQEMKFFTKKEDALYLKITVNFTGIWNKKYTTLLQ